MSSKAKETFWWSVVAAMSIWFAYTMATIESSYEDPNAIGYDSGSSYKSDVDKIISAKSKARNSANFPDTMSFRNLNTSVDGDYVELEYTAENAFGVPQTRKSRIYVGD